MKSNENITYVLFVLLIIVLLLSFVSCSGGPSTTTSASTSLPTTICGNGQCQPGFGENTITCPADCVDCLDGGTATPDCCIDPGCFQMYGTVCTDDGCCDSISEDMGCSDCAGTGLMDGCTGPVDIVADGSHVYARNNRMTAYGYLLDENTFTVIEPKGFVLVPTNQEIPLPDGEYHHLEVITLKGMDMGRWGTSNTTPEDQVAIANIGVVVTAIVDLVGVLPIDISGTSVGFCMNIADLKTVGEILYDASEGDAVGLLADLTEFVAENIDNLAICLWESSLDTATKETLISGIKALGKTAGEITQYYNAYVVMGKVIPVLWDLWNISDEDNRSFCVSVYDVGQGVCPEPAPGPCIGCTGGSSSSNVCDQNSSISFGDAASSISDRCACTTDDACTWEECDAGMELPMGLVQFAKLVDEDNDQVIVIGGSLSTSTTSNDVYLTELSAIPPSTKDVGRMMKGTSEYNVGDVQGVLLKQGGKSYAVLTGGISGGPGTQIGGDNIVYIDVTDANANDSSHEYEVTPITNLADLIKPPGASGTVEEWSKISGSCVSLYGYKMIIAGGYSETAAAYLNMLVSVDLTDLSAPAAWLIGRLPKAVADAACAISGNKFYIAGGVGSSGGLSLTAYDLVSDERCEASALPVCGFGTSVGQSWDALIAGDSLIFTKGASVLEGDDRAASFSISSISESGCVDSCHTDTDFCQANSYTSGAYCDGSESVTCGTRGDCAIEVAREACPVSCNSSTGVCEGCMVGSGPCCDWAGNFRPSTYTCSSTIEYGCPSGTSCGADVKRRTVIQKCSGSSSACDGVTSYGGWTTHDYCSSSEMCVAGNPVCQPCGTCECTSGDCCDGCHFKTSSTPCDIETQYQCEGTGCGDDVEERTRSKACSGTSAACEGSYGSWSGWTTHESCSSDEKCNSTTFSCYESTACLDCLPSSGPCCDSSGNFRPSSYVCDANVSTVYECHWGTSCGDDVGKGILKKYCSGSSELCNGSTAWTWSVHDSCNQYEKCSETDDLCHENAACCPPISWSANLTATDLTTGVKLTWNVAPGATGYVITRMPGSGSCPPTPAWDIKTITSGSTTTWTDTGISSGSCATYGIFAKNSCGNPGGCGGVDVGCRLP